MASAALCRRPINMPAPTLIAADVGNSSTKVGWFDMAARKSSELPQPAGTFSFATGQPPPAEFATRLPAGKCAWHIASVHREGTRVIAQWVLAERPSDEVLVLDFRDLPIDVRVDFPERVGLDRLAAAVAANAIRETNRPAIVVDAGSAITVDLVSAEGAFCGGVILPGFRMAAEALYGVADQLPLALLEPEAEPPPIVGTNTEAAIRSGLFWGAVGAVREIVERMARDLNPQPHVFVTGGDLRQLAQHIGHEARFVPNMVLAGIAIAARSRPGTEKE